MKHYLIRILRDKEVEKSFHVCADDRFHAVEKALEKFPKIQGKLENDVWEEDPDNTFWNWEKIDDEEHLWEIEVELLSEECPII